jgi:hypothetical protein
MSLPRFSRPLLFVTTLIFLFFYQKSPMHATLELDRTPYRIRLLSFSKFFYLKIPALHMLPHSWAVSDSLTSLSAGVSAIALLAGFPLRSLPAPDVFSRL